MKNIISQQRSILLAVALLASVLLFAGASQAQAYDNDHQNGGWDSHHRYHTYSYHNNHRGYWNQNNGVRIWINI